MGTAEILELVNPLGVPGMLVVGLILFLRDSKIIIRYPRNPKSEKTPDEVNR